MEVYWVNSLHGIAFGEDSFIANRVIATLPKMAKHKFASISLTVRDFCPTGYLRNVLLSNFKKIFPSPNMAAILNFQFLAKNGKTKICFFYLLNRVEVLSGLVVSKFGI